MSAKRVEEKESAVNGSSPNGAPSNSGLDDGSIASCKRWYQKKIDSGDVPGHYDQQISALDYFAKHILADEGEEHTAAWVLKNSAILKDRWLRKTGRKPDTADSYEKRVKIILGHYERWRRDPVNFSFGTIRKHKRRKKPEAVVEVEVDAPGELPPPDTTSVVCPLKGLTEAAIVKLPCPPENLSIDHLCSILRRLVGFAPDFSVEDAGYLAARLAVEASDYDYTKPASTQLFSEE